MRDVDLVDPLQQLVAAVAAPRWVALIPRILIPDQIVDALITPQKPIRHGSRDRSDRRHDRDRSRDHGSRDRSDRRHDRDRSRDHGTDQSSNRNNDRLDRFHDRSKDNNSRDLSNRRNDQDHPEASLLQFSFDSEPGNELSDWEDVNDFKESEDQSKGGGGA